MITPIINRKSKVPIYMQIRHYVVEAINDQHLLSNDRMPSVRGLSKDLGVSCTTIENAYNQLTAEGYLVAMVGKGYFVESIDKIIRPKMAQITSGKTKASSNYNYDFASEYISQEAFDYAIWKKHINYVLNYEKELLCGYGDLKGEEKLREVITRQFYRSRGVVARSEEIIIGSGVAPLIVMLSRLLHMSGIKEIGLENPGFKKACDVFKASGMKVSPINVTSDGLQLRDLYDSQYRACYVSPSHHFPTGFIMPISERQKILKWAQERDGYVIEDDYNFELRFEGQPIPAMQGMDSNQRVIYLGSFSTVLSPAIRLSFMVLPQMLCDLFEKSQGMFPQTASKVEQLALAHFIESGDFEKHIRKIRHHYNKKQSDAIHYIKEFLPSTLKLMKVKSGLQLLLRLPKGIKEETIIKECEKAKIKVDGLGSFRRGEKNNHEQYLVISYRGIDGGLMKKGLQALGEVIKGVL